MLYDHGSARKKQIEKENYEALKKFIISSNENEQFGEWFPAWIHIDNLEKEIEELKKENAEYKSFFSFLKKLLPKGYSIHDTIG